VNRTEGGRRGYGWTLVGIALVAVYLFPVFWMASTSLKSEADIYASPPQLFPSPPEWEVYQEAVFDNPAVLKAIRSSLIISLGTMILTLVMAAPAAYALARLRLRGGALVVLLLLITQLLPAIVIAGPLFVLFSRIDLVNSYPALILADTTITLPFAVIVLRPFFLGVPRELADAAALDGCGHARTLWHVYLPLSATAVVALAVLAFVAAWNDYYWPLVVVTTDDMRTLPVGIPRFTGADLDVQWQATMAAATMGTLPVLALYVVAQRWFLEGIGRSGLKG
jgi:multiple sugar transport system permease protein